VRQSCHYESRPHFLSRFQSGIDSVVGSILGCPSNGIAHIQTSQDRTIDAPGSGVLGPIVSPKVGFVDVVLGSLPIEKAFHDDEGVVHALHRLSSIHG
jgi:hypothetical protein